MPDHRNEDLCAPKPMVVRFASCPTHGLHGERSECFVCGGPVDQVEMVAAWEYGRVVGLLRQMVAHVGGMKSKLGMIADTLDRMDADRGVEGETEMQDDLRRWERQIFDLFISDRVAAAITAGVEPEDAMGALWRIVGLPVERAVEAIGIADEVLSTGREVSERDAASMLTRKGPAQGTCDGASGKEGPPSCSLASLPVEAPALAHALQGHFAHEEDWREAVEEAEKELRSLLARLGAAEARLLTSDEWSELSGFCKVAARNGVDGADGLLAKCDHHAVRTE